MSQIHLLITMKINDAHCHYGRESFDGAVCRSKIWANKTYDALKRDWNEYNVEKSVLFPQPLPSSLKKYLIEGIFYPFGSSLLRDFWKKFFDYTVDYSKVNKEISNLQDNRIEFVPFVSPKFKHSDLENFERIKGVKFYEPYGELSENLLEYLNERELNLIIHISEKTDRNPEKFLENVEKFDGINFQVAHCANGVPEIIEALDELPNLFVDTGACTLRFYKAVFRSRNTSFEEIVSENVEKVLFGSDEPWSEYKTQIEQINRLELSNSDKNRIFYRNYLALWG